MVPKTVTAMAFTRDVRAGGGGPIADGAQRVVPKCASAPAGDLGQLLPSAPLNAAADPASASGGGHGLSGGAIAGAWLGLPPLL